MVDLVVLPTESDNGWQAKLETNNRITTMDGGAEERLQKWLYGKRSFEIPFNMMSQPEYTILRDFWELRGGNVRGFLLWDASGFYSSLQPIGIGDGATHNFQLSVTKSDSANTIVKPVLHPVPTGTAIPIQYQGIPGGHTTALHTLTVNGVAKIEGTDYTISASTGIANISAAPGAGQAVVWTGWRYVPVRFDGPDFPLTLDSVFASVRPSLLELFNE